MTEEKPTYTDNRPHIEVDQSKIQTWELVIFEDQDVTTIDLMMVFARYLCNGSGPISPNLPNDPVDELTKEQRQEIKDSKAFKYLKRIHPNALKAMAQEFGKRATENLDPN